MQLTSGRDIAFGVSIEDDQRIHCIVVDGVDVPRLRIDIETALKFNLRLKPGNHPLWLRQPGTGRSGGRPAIDHDLKQVLIGHHDFIVDGIDRDRTEGGVRVANPSNRLQL